MTNNPVSLLQYLASFDRKERYLLVRSALGIPQFALDSTFCKDLFIKCGLSVPANALVCFDFHLDWLHAGLVLARDQDERPRRNETPDFVKEVRLDENRVASGNQEDIDLLVAWQDDAVTNILLVEAKGTTSWGNSQLRSKALRLGAIFNFGADGDRFTGVRPHFVLCSPRRPSQLDVSVWPDWMKDSTTGQPRWIELRIPGSLRSVTRCDEDGQRSATGTFWKVLTSPPQPGVIDSRAADEAHR